MPASRLPTSAPPAATRQERPEEHPGRHAHPDAGREVAQRYADRHTNRDADRQPHAHPCPTDPLPHRPPPPGRVSHGAGLATDLATALDPALVLARMGTPADPWQAAILRSTARELLLLCSRQSGKSTTVGGLAAWTAKYLPGSLTLCLSPPSVRAASSSGRSRTRWGRWA